MNNIFIFSGFMDTQMTTRNRLVDDQERLATPRRD